MKNWIEIETDNGLKMIINKNNVVGFRQWTDEGECYGVELILGNGDFYSISTKYNEFKKRFLKGE